MVKGPNCPGEVPLNEEDRYFYSLVTTEIPPSMADVRKALLRVAFHRKPASVVVVVEKVNGDYCLTPLALLLTPGTLESLGDALTLDQKPPQGSL